MRSLLKKILGLALIAGVVTNSDAQFTITGTSISFTGNTVPSTGSGRFYNYQTNNGGGTFYIENTCSTTGTQGNPGDLGGFDPAIQSAPGTHTAGGVINYGGNIRTVYYGTPCAAQHPSFGFHTGSTGIGDGTDVDLSNTANQKIQFTYQSDAAMTLVIQLLDQTYAGKLNGSETITLVADNAPHTVTIDFSDNVLGGADLTNVRQVSFEYQNNTGSPDFGISMANIKVGSAVTATNQAIESISRSKIFPNPVEDVFNLELDLKSSADVKIILTDMMGKEINVLAEGTYSSLDMPVNVSSLTNGVYTVNYYINGSPAKSELLMVK